MDVKTTNIEGLLVIKGKRFCDIRGELVKPYSTDMFPDNINRDFKEVWFTKSKLDVIRGMHLQIAPYACEKVVSAIAGGVRDVILDLRDGSASYGETFTIDLLGDDTTALYIPTGCAHGYRVIREGSVVMYMGTQVNVGSCDIGIRYDSFGYDWGIDNPILSDKDRALAPFVFGKTKF